MNNQAKKATKEHNPPVPDTAIDSVDDLAEDFACRWRMGQRPSVEEYVARFPQWEKEIQAVLPAVVLMERLKPASGDATGPAVPQPSADRLPERVGDYRILREIGRGGMGVVYEADHEALGRRVAIKVLPAHLMANEKSRARFRREAQAAARLHHTSIVPVYAVGESDGQCYYVMQLIEGRSLSAAVGGAGREFFRNVARLGLDIADALAYAHAQGIVHRDIKPSNLLLDQSGAVWVTDFGVAKILESSNLTQSGDLVGTLKYMPPERFAGQSDARGDIYSLGMTLYELLTQRPPFPDTTPHNLIKLITQEAPTRPRKINPEIPSDLETIVLKAAAQEPGHRYQTAGDLADDLRRFLHDRPILAKRASLAEQLWRWCRRNPQLAAVTAAALVLMVAITAVSVVAYATTATANHEMEKALAAAKTQRDHAEETAALALDALNRTYDRFAPTRLVVAAPELNDVGIELPARPAAVTPEAALLLEDLLRTYEQIAQKGTEFPKLQPQTAEANHRIGDIRRRLGRYEEAAAAYRMAIDLYGEGKDAGDSPIRVKLARAYNELGRTLRGLQKFEESKSMHENAIATLGAGSKPFADRPECRYELACSYYALGERDMFLYKGGPGPKGPGGKGKEGKGKGDGKGKGPPPPGWPPGPKGDNGFGTRGMPPTFAARPAIALLEQLVGEFPTVPEYRHLLACCYRDLPPDFPGGGPKPPKSSPDRAADLLRQLAKEYPNVPDYRFDLCETLARKGPPGRPGDPGADSKNRDRLNEAIALAGELAAQYPNVPEYTHAHARYHDWLGINLFMSGNLVESKKHHRQAVALQRQLVKQHPEVVAYSLWLGLMERSLGKTLGALGELKEARTLLEGSTSSVEAMWSRDPRLEGVRTFLGMAFHDLADVLEQSGEPALARAAHRKADEFEGKRPKS